MDKISTIIDAFKRKRFTGGIVCSVIEKAEKELNISFSAEYHELLQKYGSLCVKGEEFLGIDIDNYDVVKATKEARSASNSFPQDMYVIENMAIDGILLLQKTTGEIYTYQPNLPIHKVSNSLADYLSTL